MEDKKNEIKKYESDDQSFFFNNTKDILCNAFMNGGQHKLITNRYIPKGKKLILQNGQILVSVSEPITVGNRHHKYEGTMYSAKFKLFSSDTAKFVPNSFFNDNVLFDMKDTNKYFSKEEVNEFLINSIRFPNIIIEKEQDEVVEISEITSYSGMSKNDGTPTQINISIHRKGEVTKKLIYDLRVKTVGLPENKKPEIELFSTLWIMIFNEGRGKGNSTRQVNYAIEMLSNGKNIKVEDHFDNGKSKEANFELFDKIINRIQNESRYLRSILEFDKENLIISQKIN